MALFVLNDQNDETSDMVSLENGRSYAGLPTAYNYHGEGDFKRCNWAGYIERIVDVASAKKRARFMPPPISRQKSSYRACWTLDPVQNSTPPTTINSAGHFNFFN